MERERNLYREQSDEMSYNFGESLLSSSNEMSLMANDFIKESAQLSMPRGLNLSKKKAAAPRMM